MQLYITKMSTYKAPKTRSGSTVFNPSNFNYQDDTLTFADAVTLTDNQIVNSQKTFTGNVTVSNNAQFSASGNSILGDADSDVVTIKGNTTFTNTALPKTTASSTTSGNDILNRTMNDNRYGQTGGSNSWSGTQTMANATVTGALNCNTFTATGNMQFGDQTTDTITMYSNAVAGSVNASGVGAGFTLSAGSTSVANTAGDPLTLNGGATTGTGGVGSLVINSAGGTNSAGGGGISIAGGNGGTGAGVPSGTVSITSGTTGSGNGCTLTLLGAQNTGGNATLKAGNGVTPGTLTTKWKS